MGREVRLFWSAYATAQYLEEDAGIREQIEACVDLISRFPLIGTKLVKADIEHRRRFVCAGLRVIYDLKEARLLDAEMDQSASKRGETIVRVDITIMRYKRS